MAPRPPLAFKIGLHYFFPLLLVLLLGLLALSSFILCCSEPSISDGTGVNTTGQTGTVTGFVLGSVNIRWILLQRKGETENQEDRDEAPRRRGKKHKRTVGDIIWSHHSTQTEECMLGLLSAEAATELKGGNALGGYLCQLLVDWAFTKTPGKTYSTKILWFNWVTNSVHCIFIDKIHKNNINWANFDHLTLLTNYYST